MKNEFVPYDIALAMKELGFDEPCLFRYTAQKDLTNGGCYDNSSPSDAMLTADEIHESHMLAPLYQQAFRWFREKHGIGGYVRRGSIKMHEHLKENGFVVADYEWRINKTDGTHTWGHGMEDTYEEAELAYLRKLIEEV